MTPEQREALELQADRSRRRGEVAQALAAYQALAAAFPEDRGVALKLSQLAAMLQPAELLHPKARSDVPAQAVPSTLEEQAEAFAARGDFLNAAAVYRRALQQRPGNELLEERLGQLVELSRQHGPRPGTPPPAASQQEDPEAQLRRLLERLSTRRRVR